MKKLGALIYEYLPLGLSAIIPGDKNQVNSFLGNCAHQHGLQDIPSETTGAYLYERYRGNTPKAIMDKLKIHPSWKSRFEGMYSSISGGTGGDIGTHDTGERRK